MNLKANRKNVSEYLKEFRKLIPKRSSMFSRSSNVDISRLGDIKDKIELFFERGTLISPMSIDKNSIDTYMETLNLVKQFPTELSPETTMEFAIFNKTENSKGTRRILLPSVMESDLQTTHDYEKMIAYYLLMGGGQPVERFSKVEMSMKQHGVKPDMRYGYNEIWRCANNKIRGVSYIKDKISKRVGFFQKSSTT